MLEMHTTYRDDLIMEISYDNKRHIVLAIDQGYEPFLDARDLIMDQFNCELTNQYGLTDMYASFEFKGKILELEYFSMDEMVTLITDATDDDLLQEFRKIARAITLVLKKPKEEKKEQ